MSFCTFIPERNHSKLQIVFGAKEREKVESIRDSLTNSTQNAYDEAKTYHDGKWLYLSVNSEEVVQDIKKLLRVKRKPKSSESMPATKIC
jgi:predicted RNA-binding protein with PUA-like domain